MFSIVSSTLLFTHVSPSSCGSRSTTQSLTLFLVLHPPIPYLVVGFAYVVLDSTIYVFSGPINDVPSSMSNLLTVSSTAYASPASSLLPESSTMSSTRRHAQ
ncbi:unnamed protein product [Sphenostylis stenocarpa]|uniref:Uncharacterized protein n=1 Tax=Sphenostylis stenocarpa TaxID=92480 RepID=A0AA86VKM0_9FABA|nr:unnamed protein product [Sphenostylis stenocarpa]